MLFSKGADLQWGKARQILVSGDKEMYRFILAVSLIVFALSASGLSAQEPTPPSPKAEPPSAGTGASATGSTPNNAPPKKDTPPEVDQSAFQLVTGIGAEVAGEEVTSYKVDTTNNALSQTNVGRKTVEILLGGGFILPWHIGGHWIENSYPNDPAYKNYRPWETFLSIRFAPASDQTINGFVVGGGYRITKYFTLLTGYAVTPFNEPTHGFRVAASQVVAANPTIFPYNHFNADDLLHNRPGAFDGFPLFLYNANGVTTTQIFPTSPTVVHYHSGIYFGVGIPLNLTALFKPSS